MCGIAAIVALEGAGTAALESIGAMAAAIRHRGPDGEGIYRSDRVALANRRLAIIDLETGNQPMYTEDGRYVLVYNGEIFNFRELRVELEREGVRFRTHSDTEVVLQGLALHGLPFLDQLDGMFAFVAYDTVQGVVFAARDAFGIKPLYFQESGGALFIASEIKALRASVHWKSEVDRDAAAAFLQCGYVPGSRTVFRGVQRVAPGHALVIRGGSTKQESFSSREKPWLHSQPVNGRTCADVLIRSVEQSLVADVPVGLYLSGGIDSSLIASIVSRELNRKLHSYSIRFSDDPAFDEGPYAKAVADALGLEHVSYEARPSDFLDLGLYLRSLEEPMADPSAIALFLLSREVGKNLKVVLSGEGGDELFGGYHRYYWHKRVERYQSVPAFLRSGMEEAAIRFGGARLRRCARKLRETSTLSPPRRYMSWFSPFSKAELQELLIAPRKTDLAGSRFEEVFMECDALSPTSQPQWVDLRTFLVDDLLPKADKMAMANSLEVRVPFLQAEVVQAAFAVPDSDRVNGRETKPVLRRMLRNYLGSEIVDRPKQGFEVPLGRWFRGPLKPLLNTALSEEKVRGRGLVQWEPVQRILSEHELGRTDRGLALFSLAMLHAWADEWVD